MKIKLVDTLVVIPIIILIALIAYKKLYQDKAIKENLIISQTELKGNISDKTQFKDYQTFPNYQLAVKCPVLLRDVSMQSNDDFDFNYAGNTDDTFYQIMIIKLPAGYKDYQTNEIKSMLRDMFNQQGGGKNVLFGEEDLPAYLLSDYVQNGYKGRGIAVYRNGLIYTFNIMTKGNIENKFNEFTNNIKFMDKQDESFTQDKKAYSLADIYKNVKSSILLIVTRNQSDFSLGSAFIISSDGVALTNYHVLSHASDAILMDENKDIFPIDEILEANEDLDYVIFRIKTSSPLPYLKVANIGAEIGEECFAIGNPEGLTQTLSKGIISSYRENRKFIQTTAEITHGSSGGALFNESGEVIGMTTSGIGEANLNFAVNMEVIPYKTYLNQDYSNNKESDKSNLEYTKIKNLISDYYYNIERNNYSRLESLFNTYIKRYFNKYGLSRNEVIEMIKSYDNQFGVTSKEAKIRWNTFEVSKLEHGGYKINFILDYSLNRINNNKASNFTIDTYIEMTLDYKICSIYENILSRK